MESDDVNASRHLVVGGLATGLVAALDRAAAAETATSNAPGTAMPLQDPSKKYPHPPFQRQQQEWPGLASKMNPPPDHGETSYKGSARLAERKALIAGGDSGMGRAAAIAYAREGADVAINYFPTEEPDAREVIALIKDAGRKALPIPGDLRDEAFCQRLVDEAVRGLGGLDIVVCNAGRQQAHQSILDITTEQLDATMKTNIYAPVLDHQSAAPASAARRGNHRNRVGAGLQSVPRTIRLCTNRSGDDELCEVARETAWTEGHSRQRRCAQVNLDAIAGQRRRHRRSWKNSAA
jgi:NAD(P)-dependent dehydrogenase (short-subunit alcohol dehydrogenase family)